MLLRVFKIKRLPRLVAKQVVVHTCDGHSMEGVLLGVYVDAVALGHASFYGGEQGRVTLEGDQVIPISNVSFIQELGPMPSRSRE